MYINTCSRQSKQEWTNGLKNIAVTPIFIQWVNDYS